MSVRQSTNMIAFDTFQRDRRLKQYAERTQVLPQNQRLFDKGETARAIFYIVDGWVKTTLDQSTGHESVLGLHGPETMVGLNGLHDTQHCVHAITLTPVQVLKIPLHNLPQQPDLQSLLNKAFAQELKKSTDHLKQILNRDAKTRVAGFLLEFGSNRNASDTHELIIPFSRTDIAAYLGMALETLSRTLMYFQQHHYIKIHKRTIYLRDIPALQQLLARVC